MAYLLDTNILSELMKPQPSQSVEQWIDQQIQSTLFTSTITVSEMLYGAEALPDGKRKALFQHELSTLFEYDFNGRILPFSYLAAQQYAKVANERTKQGLHVHHADCQIAAIALEHGLTLVTRNTKDFDCVTGLELFNPFDFRV